MKLSAGNRAARESRIDPSSRPDASVVLRYRDAVRFCDDAGRDAAVRRLLPETSIREGVRVVALPPYKGVAIDVLDETSAMATGSLKSIDGCLAAAICRAEGTARVAFESGGNTGSALTRYGRSAGLETFFFCPGDTLDLLDSRLFDGPAAHLIAVADRRRAKEFAALFATAAGIRRVPEKAWRHASGMFRGLFVLERMLATGAYGWICQTVSAAFGPIGMYDVLAAFRKEIGRLPQFLGIQQEGNCPMFRAWHPAAAKSLEEAARGRGTLLARTMYDDSPGTHGTWRDLRRLLLMTRGDMATVNGRELDSRLRPSADYGSILDLLRSRDIAITAGPAGIVETAGIIALAGILKAVDAGAVVAGETVLCCLTGGVSAADGRARPERVVHDAADVLDFAGTVREGS